MVKKSKRIKFKNRNPEHRKSSYYSRFAPKRRRRREGKTDYHLRSRLLAVDKNRYNAVKYRLVVRKSNKFITAQLISYSPTGDKVFISASSEELTRYGFGLGFSSYPAAYCVGLLISSRFITKLTDENDEKNLKLNRNTQQTQESSSEAKITEPKNDSEDSQEEENDFDTGDLIVPDLGLYRVISGCNILGVVKGALDGGLNVNYSDKKSPGGKYDEDMKKWTYDPEENRRRIFGGSSKLQSELGPEKVEEMIEKVHEEIKNEPWKMDKDMKKRSGQKKKARVEKKELKKNRKKEQRLKKFNQKKDVKDVKEGCERHIEMVDIRT